MHKTKQRLKNATVNNKQHRKGKNLPIGTFNIPPPPANDDIQLSSFITDESRSNELLLQRGHGVQPASDPRPAVLLPVLHRAYTSPPLLLPLVILLIVALLLSKKIRGGGWFMLSHLQFIGE